MQHRVVARHEQKLGCIGRRGHEHKHVLVRAPRGREDAAVDAADDIGWQRGRIRADGQHDDITARGHDAQCGCIRRRRAAVGEQAEVGDRPRHARRWCDDRERGELLAPVRIEPRDR